MRIVNPALLVVVFVSTFFTCDATVRTWTHKNGNTFKAECVDFKYPNIYLKSANANEYEVYLYDLVESDHWYVWTHYSQDRIVTIIENWDYRTTSINTKSTFIEDDRDDLITITYYLSSLAVPLKSIYQGLGEYKEDDNTWKRIHSGMIYYALDWLESRKEAFMDPRTELDDYLVDEELQQVRYISELFKALNRNENFLLGRLGQQFPVKFKPKGIEDFRQPYFYYAYLPKEYDKKIKSACLMWLPGEGEYGFNIKSLLKWDLPKRLAEDTEYPFLVISVGHGNTLMDVTYLRSVYDDIVKRFEIDIDRFICTGMSSGASATWRWACKSPELFAAIVPVAGIMPHFEIQRLTKLPIWLFNNEEDNLWIQRIAINLLEERNESFKYTIYKGIKGHNAWNEAYSDPGLVEWMLKQKRRSIEHPPNPIDELQINNQLSEGIVKVLPSYDLISIELPPKKAGIGDSVLNQHYHRNGLIETYDIHTANNYLIEFFKDKSDTVLGAMVQIINDDIDGSSFGMPYENISKQEIRPPYERLYVDSMHAYCAYYFGRKLNISVPLKLLRNKVISEGFALTNEERVIYHQLMTPSQYVFEIQIGIEAP